MNRTVDTKLGESHYIDIPTEIIFIYLLLTEKVAKNCEIFIKYKILHKGRIRPPMWICS